MTDEADKHIDESYKRSMNSIARILDNAFNGDERPKRVAFVLLITDFDKMQGRVNYISNGKRSDVVTMLKEILGRFDPPKGPSPEYRDLLDDSGEGEDVKS